MFERTKVFCKKSSLRDKIHQIPPSLRDFSVFNHAMRNFYCTFAPVLGKATNRLSNFLPAGRKLETIVN